MQRIVLLVVVFMAAMAGGCASGPARDSLPAPASEPTPQGGAPAPVDRGAAIAAAAAQLVGLPYRFGGVGPEEFDCSGLVTYVHNLVGVEVPRTAAEQFLFAKPVALRALRPGDLVFFSPSRDKVTHVGVYTGGGRFVHAPQRGRPVEYGNLDSDYYRVNFAGAGRLYDRR